MKINTNMRIETGEEAKSNLSCEGEEDARKCESKDRSPDIDPGNGPAHANVAMGDGPYLSVSQRHRSSTRRIEDVEEVDEESNQAHTCGSMADALEYNDMPAARTSGTCWGR